MKTVFFSFIPAGVENFILKVLSNDFLCGTITGIFICLLLRLVWQLCFRRKSCSHIEVQNSSGTVMITIPAIFSVIKHAAAPIKCLELNRLQIFDNPAGLDIELRASIKDEERPVSQVMTELASVVRTQLNSFFGVEKIYNIKLDISNCKKCRSNSGSAAVDSGDTADPVKTEPVNSGRTISLKTPVKNDRNE